MTGQMLSLSTMIASAIGVINMNAIANMNVCTNKEDFLLGVDVGRAKGKKQQGSPRWVG